MTVWLFYYKDKVYDDYTRFYAFTNNKEFAEEFQKQRNMDSFACIKKKGINKKEYAELKGKYGKLELIHGTFNTKTFEFGKKYPVKVLCTFEEEESIVIKTDKLWEEYSRFLFDVRSFKKEYLKPLETLLFVKFYGFYKIKYKQCADYFYEPYYCSYGPVEGLILDDYRNMFSYDELKVFLKFFKNTFHEKKKPEELEDDEW